jgi:hypothetical protein
MEMVLQIFSSSVTLVRNGGIEICISFKRISIRPVHQGRYGNANSVMVTCTNNLTRWSVYYQNTRPTPVVL